MKIILLMVAFILGVNALYEVEPMIALIVVIIGLIYAIDDAMS